jgi:hypothetical protein
LTAHPSDAPDGSVRLGTLTLAAPLQRIGGTQAVDANGCIIHSSAAHLVNGPWQAAVEALISGCQDTFGASLHSVYLRGSVPRGLAIDGLSDLDALAVVNGPQVPVDEWKEALTRRVRAVHQGCRHVDLRLWGLQPLLTLPAGHPTRFLLKVQGLCIWGEDPAGAWPAAHLSEARIVLSGLAPALALMHQALARRLVDDPTRLKQRCRWLAKKIVRAGFELVAEREQAYTRDLFPCWEAFSRHHPAQSAMMHDTLLMAVDPCGDPARIKRAVLLGDWILTQDAQRTAQRPGS